MSPRKVDPALKAWLLARIPPGHQFALTGKLLARAAWHFLSPGLGARKPNIRRIQEAIAEAVADGEPIGSCAGGYYRISTDAERKAARAEISKRLTALARRLRALDAGKAERLGQLALEISG